MVEDGGLWQRQNGKQLNFGFGIYKGVFGMTRRERDILKASVSWTDKTLTVKEEKAFQVGAKWADKTMIDKATQWLFENVYDYLNPEDQERVESFRKEMEK